MSTIPLNESDRSLVASCSRDTAESSGNILGPVPSPGVFYVPIACLLLLYFVCCLSSSKFISSSQLSDFCKTRWRLWCSLEAV